MPAMFDSIPSTLGAALVTGGTLTLGYPAGRSRADYLMGTQHTLTWNGVTFNYPQDFSVTLNATTVVLTMVAAMTIPVASAVFVTLDRAGSSNSSFEQQTAAISRRLALSGASAALASTVLVTLGSAIAVDAASIAASQTPAGVSGTTQANPVLFVVNGTRAASGKVTMDVPRNVTVTSASNVSAFTLTVNGIDCYGAAMTEHLACPNATTTQGKKAFARVDSAAVYGTGTMAAMTIGHGKVLGLPINLQSTALVAKELVDGAVPGSAGTYVAAVNSTPTATTGDTRGTYTPNGSPDGSVAYQALIYAVNIDQGAAQYVGL